MKILIHMPHRNSYMPVQMVQCLLDIKKTTEDAWHQLDFRPICWAMVNVARNEYMRIAYNEWYDYVLILDDDNPVDHDVVVELLQHKLDVVGVAIPSRRRNEDWEYTLNMFRESYSVWDYTEYEKFPIIPTEERLLKVDALATSCILISRNVVEAMHENYWDKPFEHRVEWYTKEWKIVDIDKLDESVSHELICNHVWGDMIFCRRLKKLGFDIYVDTSIRWYHLVEDNTIHSNEFII